jgi:hypothetical protein
VWNIGMDRSECSSRNASLDPRVWSTVSQIITGAYFA